MKKILIALVLFASFQMADAQVKSAADAAKALSSAKADSQNPKKAAKAATWTKLGQCYVNAYNAPIGNIWVGATKQELTLVMGNQKPSSTETVEVGGELMMKEVYADKNLYFRENGQLALIEVTSVVEPDALAKAVEAYAQAYTLDSKKAKEIAAAYDDIAGKLVNDAYTKYTFGDLATASKYFEEAANVSGKAPLSQIDTNSVYNAGFTAQLAGDKNRAKSFFEQCCSLGYYQDGEVFAKLADVDTTNAKAYLEEGFTKFPQSQSILIGLINHYLKTKDDPEKLFTLLDAAKVNEPTNASLYYVEGNIRLQLGQEDEAVVAYRKCADIDPAYEFGFIGEGIMHYNKAIEIQQAAQMELDDNKYAALVEDFSAQLKACIEPFEKAFNISKSSDIKVNVAEYLKNAYYRFRDDSPEYQAGYEKYNGIVSKGSVE